MRLKCERLTIEPNSIDGLLRSNSYLPISISLRVIL